MSIFEHFFGKKDDATASDSKISFGRFSDSYKQTRQYDAWDLALEKFENEDYLESYIAFLDYLNDETEENVKYHQHDGRLEFEILQGSKKISGTADRKKIRVEARIATALSLNIDFMQRLIEQNFGLNYSRFGLDIENNITIVFDSFVLDASPYKLYYAIRELAINADKFDDLLIDEFEEPTFAILKHTNACGVASRNSLLQAWKDALACDPVSAFGGVLICNGEVDAETAKEISKLFFEVLIAPSFAEEAVKILSEKKNRILLQRNNVELSKKQFKTLLNGVIEQDKDLIIEGEGQMKSVTERQATVQELKDLFFANKIVKHTKSNTVVLAKNGQLCASGVGQTSRVDALRQAIEKAGSFGFDLKGAVMASDAFFPFPDCVEIAADAGITMILQPGGSVKDQLSIDMANEKGVGMVMTGVRHFKH